MNAALTVTSWLDLAASLTLAGGLVSATVVAPASGAGRRALRAAVVALAVALALEFVLTAIRMHEVAGIGGAPLLVDLAGTRWGRLWFARLAGLAVLGIATRRARPRAGFALLVPPWLLLRSFQGHAGAHGTVPALVDGLHLTAGALWIGALVQLYLRSAPPDAAVAVRVRTLATASLVVLLPAGVYGAFLHVPSAAKLVGSPYGRTLIVKLGLAAVLVGLGARNHFRHVPALAAGAPGAARTLTRNVGIELVLAAGVLLLSALLGVLPMPHPTP